MVLLRIHLGPWALGIVPNTLLRSLDGHHQAVAPLDTPHEVELKGFAFGVSMTDHLHAKQNLLAIECPILQVSLEVALAQAPGRTTSPKIEQKNDIKKEPKLQRHIHRAESQSHLLCRQTSQQRQLSCSKRPNPVRTHRNRP